MMIAHVYFIKEIEKDNYFEGCHGGRRFTFDEKFTVDFKDTQDLKEQLYNHAACIFDIPNKKMFLTFIGNEWENNRFDYSQNEDDEGTTIDITEENPNGWLADYMFYIDKVTQEINYTF